MDEVKYIPVYKIETSPDALRIEALKRGDVLAHSAEESRMLLNIKGVSINTKPRKDGRFQGYLLAEGKPVYFYGKTIEEVEWKLTNAINNGVKPKRKERKKKSLTLAAWVEKWIDLYKKPNVKPLSLNYIQDSVKPIVTELGDKDISKITADELQITLLNIPGSRMRDASKVTIKQAFAKALQQGLIKTNPCDAIEIKKHRRQHRNALTVEQQSAFVKEIAGAKFETLFKFLLGTGLRIGEALALTPKDIDLAQHTVSVNKNVVFIKGEKTLQETPKTDSSVRTVPIVNFAWEALFPFDAAAKEVFPYKYAAVQSQLKRISAKLGFKISAHILRHTYATRLEEAGVSPKIKQYLMGHATLEMTQQVYTDIQPAYLKQQYPALLDAFKP